MKKLKIPIFAILPFTFWACTAQPKSKVPFYNSPDFTPLWFSNLEVKSKNLHTIAPFKFIDQNRNTITENTVKGKIHIANFFFSICPSICPKMTHNLVEVQKTFATDTSVVQLSYSVMPWIDSVGRLKMYADVNNIDVQKWHLLTGEAGKIYTLARQSYFAEEAIGYTRDSTEFLHTEHVLLVDTDGHLRGVYNGTLPLEIDRLIEDVKTLRSEKNR